MSTASGEAVTAVGEIAQTIRTIVSDIASAALEQEAATAEIAHSAVTAAGSAGEVSLSVAGISEAATHTGSASRGGPRLRHGPLPPLCRPQRGGRRFPGADPRRFVKARPG